jgi:hypothetical protein
MTPFTSEEHILFNSKPIWVIFVALDAISVELQNIWEAQGKHSNDQRSWASNCKLVLLT